MPRHWLRSIAFALSICLGQTASADPVEPKIIPQCLKYRTVDGQVVCGWVVTQADGTDTPNRWQLVLRADAELVKLRDEAALVEQLRVQLDVKIENLDAAVAASNVAYGVCEKERARLFDKWEDENEKRHKAELKPTIGGSVGWYIAAGEALILAGIGASIALDWP